MTNITIQTINSTLVVDSRLIANELGIQHKNVKELIKTYQTDFEGFGQVAFETQAGDVRYAETFYLLNEDQCYLLLTFVKNTPEARQAKVNLVKAFKAAREKVVQPQLPSDYLSALKALVSAEEEKHQLALKAAELTSKVIELTPKVKMYEAVCEIGKNVKVGELAKILAIKDMGQNNMFKFLKKKGLLQFNNIPYQTYVNSGYFTCVKTRKGGEVYIVTLVTPKGCEYITKALLKAGYEIPSKAA
ncbi:MAG: phage regulatory protein/antirepressor Ant [Gloeotrichia echinulata IR180]